MKEINLPTYTGYLFKEIPIRVLDSGHMIHFYFKDKYGITSTSYSKDSLINMFYKEILK